MVNDIIMTPYNSFIVKYENNYRRKIVKEFNNEEDASNLINKVINWGMPYSLYIWSPFKRKYVLKEGIEKWD